MSVRIVSVCEATTPAELEPLARAVFGEGDRPAGWFRRKVHRECVQAGLSKLAVTDDFPPRDPRSWVGYALVGTPASLDRSVRTAGIGVRETWRGRGLGRRLIEAAIDEARRSGFRAMLTPSTLPLVSFYEGLGFRPGREHVTLLGFGHGRSGDLAPSGSTAPERWPPPQPWDPPRTGRTRWTPWQGWLREAWERTDPGLRHTFAPEGVRLHVSREGRALVIHRVLASPRLRAAGIAERLHRFCAWAPEGTPVVLVSVDAVSSITDELSARGWNAVQRSRLMERPLAADRADAARPGAGAIPTLYKSSHRPDDASHHAVEELRGNGFVGRARVGAGRLRRGRQSEQRRNRHRRCG